MGMWFDRLAKQSARSALRSGAVDDGGLTRRQVITRGAVVTGVAWTAPMILAAQPAFAGASICLNDPTNPDFSICPDGTTSKCCPKGQKCVQDFFKPTGTFICDVGLGGTCTNQGEGQCNGGASRCNKPNGPPAQNPSICGGPGADCDDGSICLFTSPCFGVVNPDTGKQENKRCGGEGAPCTSTSQCAQVDGPALTCRIAEGMTSGTCQP